MVRSNRNFHHVRARNPRLRRDSESQGGIALPPSRNVDVSRLFGPSGVSKKYFSTKSLTSFFSFVDILQT
ncbi:hypothetical protein GS8_24 [Geobacillus stearothermophilus]|uniref:Uncharacterized protein n=1 Tax=Geobacillus stearothermophilus TaxID=1422 RepID=A0ABQ7HK35_GEOSE|nr:hypothetical protein GS8_24 [Geobacillus stearothermophilus]